jgi:rare lipoprotein A
MKRFRRRRRRRAALALSAATAALAMTATAAVAASGNGVAAQFDASKNQVRFGAKVKLKGRFPARATDQQPEPEGGGEAARSQQPSRSVRIEFRPRGSRSWRKAKTTVTDRDGRYVERVRVKRTGSFRAVHDDGRRSPAERVRVKSRLRARLKRKHVKVGDKVPIEGRVKPRGSRRKVVVRIGGDRLRTRTNRSGSFRVRWKADRTGRFKAAVRAKGDELAAGSRARAGRATVYRPAVASWYGPGFYGHRTACGQILTASTVGVAHRTLPCGTKLTLRYHGRSVRVRVIDRGPYVHGREFDLTGATRSKLGFPSTGTVLSSR